MHIVENMESKKSTKVQKVSGKQTNKQTTLILLPPREKCLRLPVSCLAFKEPGSQLSL